MANITINFIKGMQFASLGVYIMEQIPIILYTWKKYQDIVFCYSQKSFSTEHISYLLNLENSPFQKTCYQIESGQDEYSYNGIYYIYWWIAGPISKTNEHSIYTRIVIASAPKNILNQNVQVDFEELWKISDDTENFFVHLKLKEKLPIVTYSSLSSNASQVIELPSSQPPNLIDFDPLADQAKSQPIIGEQSQGIKNPYPESNPPQSKPNLNQSIESTQYFPSQNRLPSTQHESAQNNIEVAQKILPSSSMIIKQKNIGLDYYPTQNKRLGIACSVVKSQASKQGKNSFWVFTIILIVIFGISFIFYGLPYCFNILERCPIPTFANFMYISKNKGNQLDCPISTPVYDMDFNKIGSVHNQNPNSVEIIVFSEYKHLIPTWNMAIHHQEPRKLLAVLKILHKSSQGKEIQKSFDAVAEKLKPILFKALARVNQVIKNRYTKDKQEKLFQALTDKELAPFLLAPVNAKIESLKIDLEKYDWWGKVKPSAKQIGNKLWHNYTGSDITSDVLKLAGRGVCSLISSLCCNFLGETPSPPPDGYYSDVIEERLQNLTSKPEISNQIKTSAWQLVNNVAQDMQLMKNGSFWEGKQIQDLKENYLSQADYVVEKIKERGINLGKQELIEFWEILEKDQELIDLYDQSESLMQEQIGNFLKVWVDQFFPKDADNTEQLQVISTTLMREILYGKPEPIIVVGNDNKKPAGKPKLEIGKF